MGSKTRSLGQILEKPCVHYRDQIFVQIHMKLGQNLFLEKSETSSKMGHFGSKTTSLCQILEKPCLRRLSCVVNFLACVRSRGHIFCLIIKMHGQNVCLDENTGEFGNGLCGGQKPGH